MKKLLVIIGLVLALCIPVYADELVSPFSKVKEIVTAKGSDKAPNVKGIEFTIKDNIDISMIVFMTSLNGNVGILIVNKDKTAAQLVGFDAEVKVYYVTLFIGGWTEPEVIDTPTATKFGFHVFRLLVERGLI